VNDDRSPARRGSGDFLRVRHLRLLELVDRGGSLAAAAREMHLSQPAVTKMLQELEAAFGTVLVARAARGGSLSAQGRVALQRLKLGLSQFDSAIATARSDRADVPVLRIGVVPLVSVSLLPLALRQLAHQGMPMRLSLRDSTAPGLLQWLADGQVDCAIGRPEPQALASLQAARLVHVPLVEDPLVLACAPAHRLAKARRVDLATLRSQDWVLAAAGSYTRRVFDALFVAAGLDPPTPMIESMSFHANLQMIHAVGALTIAPASAVKLYQRIGIAQSLRSTPRLSTGPLSLMYVADHEQLPTLRARAESRQAASRQGSSRSMRG